MSWLGQFPRPSSTLSVARGHNSRNNVRERVYDHVRRVRPRLNPGFEQIADELPSGGIMSGGRTRMRGRYRFGSKRKRGRRSFRRRRNYRRRTLMPWKVVRNLKTVQYLSFDAGAGTISTVITNVNSGNDPIYTTGSRQPLGWDQYATLYERYCIIGGKVDVVATSADATNPLAVGLNFQQNASALTSYEHYKELPNTSFRLMTPEQDKVTFGGRFSVRKFFGHGRMLTDDRLSAEFGLDPTDRLYCHFFAQAVDQAANPGIVHMVITFYQTVVFYKPKAPARS